MMYQSVAELNVMTQQIPLLPPTPKTTPNYFNMLLFFLSRLIISLVLRMKLRRPSWTESTIIDFYPIKERKIILATRLTDDAAKIIFQVEYEYCCTLLSYNIREEKGHIDYFRLLSVILVTSQETDDFTQPRRSHNRVFF